MVIETKAKHDLKLIAIRTKMCSDNGGKINRTLTAALIVRHQPLRAIAKRRGEIDFPRTT